MTTLKLFPNIILPLLCLLVVGCSQHEGYAPINPDTILFWDRQVTETAELLSELVEEFNEGRDAPLVKAEYTGNYAEIFRKVRASIQARSVPDMAVAYESMTVEYIRAGAALQLDPLLNDSESGLTKEDWDDFFPVVIETNRYREFGGKTYSFPFCKSVLMMYFNRRVLGRAGLDAPPETWEEFLDQCRTIKAATGLPAYAVSVDASTIDGMIFSMGGEVVSGRTALFDSREALEVFKLLETLTREKLAYPIDGGTHNDKIALAHDEVAFVFRSSSHRTNVTELMDGDLDRWGMTRIPQADPAQPATVLYGPNICIFDTTDEHTQIAWDFVRFFTSKENVVRWALGSGYVPIRKSAAQDPRIQELWDEWPCNRAAFDCLPFSKSEPTVMGWQEVRGLIEKAETAVLTGFQSAEDATAELTRDANAVLADQ